MHFACNLALISALLVRLDATSAALDAGVEPRVDYEFAGRGDLRAVRALLRRVLQLPAHRTLPFQLELVDHCTGHKPSSSRSNLCFQVSDAKGDRQDDSPHIRVRGTSAVDIARGAAHYLRTLCNMSFAWGRAGGNQVRLPSEWPSVGDHPLVGWRLRDISYGFNVCTFSYSHVWYKFNETSSLGNFNENWENVIDWMALSGINLALAYTGQEEVYRKVYLSFGVNDTVFGEWSNGPAHLTWSRGQSMHGVGGPLPRIWMKAQWTLQRRILKRMRSLGITPILPAFQGNVPPVMSDLYPLANITVQKAHWGGGRAAWLDATDPLFQHIGNAFMKQLTADFGVDIDGDGVGDVTDHWYEADGYFAAGDPPWRRRLSVSQETTADPSSFWPGKEVSSISSSSFSSLSAMTLPTEAEYDTNAYVHASKAYLAMNQTDPDAIWHYQGWILDDSDHSLQVMKGYAAAVPRGKLLVSDMWAEWRPIIPMLEKAGLPYLFGVLQNFGGTLFLGMSVNALNNGSSEDPVAVPSIFDTFSSKPGGVGVGAFPEGIDQNPAYFTYLFDAAWISAPIDDMGAWWARYALERYGATSTSAAQAWMLLGTTVYGIDERESATEGGFWREKAKGGLLSSPLMYDRSDEPSHAWYNATVVLEAWELLAQASVELGNLGSSATLRYDIVNVGREVLDRVADGRYVPMANATSARVAIHAGQRFLEVQHDADTLLCTDPSFALSSWVNAAEALGTELHDASLGKFLNRMARAQVTTWLPACHNASDVAGGVCSLHESDTSPPPLEDYANKAWGGLVQHYYGGRVRCYLNQWADILLHKISTFNVTAYHACIDVLAQEFQDDTSASKFTICNAPQGDAITISARLIDKYRDEVGHLSSMPSSGKIWNSHEAGFEMFL